MPIDEEKRKHDRDIDALIAAGLVALRRALGITLLLKLFQLTFRQAIVEADRLRVLAILQSELSERISPEGAIYRAITDSVLKAGPTVIDYETIVPDEFGLTRTTRLEHARDQLVEQVDVALQSAVAKEEFRSSASVLVFGILAGHGAFKRVMAYDTARAYNLQLLAGILASNVDRLAIRVSDQHVITDICDHLVGVFPVIEITGPPYRRLPPFHPFCNCYVIPFKG